MHENVVQDINIIRQTQKCHAIINMYSNAVMQSVTRTAMQSCNQWHVQQFSHAISGTHSNAVMQSVARTAMHVASRLRRTSSPHVYNLFSFEKRRMHSHWHFIDSISERGKATVSIISSFIPKLIDNFMLVTDLMYFRPL